jgi:hypothetical protein
VYQRRRQVRKGCFFEMEEKNQRAAHETLGSSRVRFRQSGSESCSGLFFFKINFNNSK